MQTTSSSTLLIIDSERKFLQKLTTFFQQKNITSHIATNASMAAAMLRDNPYPIIITDFFLPNETVNMLEMVREHRPDALVIILTGFGTLDTAVAAIREGCFDYLQKPVRTEQLVDSINRAIETMERSKKTRGKVILEVAAESNNPSSLRERASEEFYRASRYQTNLSLIMANLDYTETGNDTFGPETGTLLMKKVIPLIKEQIRTSDFVSAYGQDKIGIVLPKTSRLGAVGISRKLIHLLTDLEFLIEGKSAKTSISIGISSYPEDPILTDSQLLKFAEQAANMAGADGKDKIGFYGLDIFTPSTLSATVDRENARLSQLVESKRGLWKKLKRVYVESLDSLVKSHHVDDGYHSSHADNVSRYAEDIARKLDLDTWVVEKIKYAGILHDIGKIGVPDEILLKPDRLTGAEFDKIKRHCEIGVQLVRDAHFLQDEIPIIMHHHEWFDGSGYPCGLREDDIPIGARILGMVDTFDSLTQKRCYRKKYAPDEAMEVIKKYSGMQFDPRLVNCLEKYVRDREYRPI